jgi:hypothetical protein
MASETRSFPSPCGNEGSNAKPNQAAHGERDGDQLKCAGVVHGSGISASSINFNNSPDWAVFPTEMADLRPMSRTHQENG